MSLRYTLAAVTQIVAFKSRFCGGLCLGIAKRRKSMASRGRRDKNDYPRKMLSTALEEQRNRIFSKIGIPWTHPNNTSPSLRDDLPPRGKAMFVPLCREKNSTRGRQRKLKTLHRA
jgi:hypothetical protein